MNRKEFSTEFDTTINAYSSIAGATNILAFNEYEKSVFLTKALEELAIELYNGKNIYGDSFEKTEEIRRYLSDLVVTSTIEPSEHEGGLSKYSKFFLLPTDILFITYEAFIILDETDRCSNGNSLEIIPVAQDDFHRLVDNPFRGLGKSKPRRALRLDIATNIVEIVSKYNGKYMLRYLRRPNPIILEGLQEGLTIDNKTLAIDCELHEALHRKILDRAIRLALLSRGYNINRES